MKFYSSGMQMRLGFGVAACLEPHVLLVDEVLAVGDSAFQQRCLERMRSMMLDGTTPVFVSHDLAAAEGISGRIVWLHHGRVEQDGPTRHAPSYRESLEQVAELGTSGDGIVRVAAAQVTGRVAARSVPGAGGDHDGAAQHLLSSGRICIGCSEDRRHRSSWFGT